MPSVSKEVEANARLYDPVLGRFLSPDPYVQAPDNTQNYNRYSYALNNPLAYTDPDGEFFWTILTGIFDFIGKAFFQGGLDPTSKNARHNAWRNYDPTASWSNTNKAWKIDMGLFKTDPNKKFWGRSLELISRFTWQAPQSLVGYSISGGHNLFGGVKSVDYYGGATVVETYGKDWGGMTHSSYILGNRGIKADPKNDLFQHEYGHYLQSQSSGWFYYSKYGIPSALSKGDYFDHGNHPAEQDANVRALRYFMKNEDGFTVLDWIFDRAFYGHPIIGYNQSLSFDDPVNQAALKNGRLRLEWFDYLHKSHIILSGLLNAFISNKRF